MAEYVNPDVLISDEELESKLGDPSIRVIEVDEDTSLYGKGHIPGAIAWNWKTELHDPLRREFIDQKQLASLLSGATYQRKLLESPDMQRALVQMPHGAATDAAALAGSQRNLHRDVLGPALAELPGLHDPFGDRRRPLARGAKHRAQLIVDRIGKHWAVGLVRAR